MAVDTTVALRASYDTKHDAVADYEAVKDLDVQSGLVVVAATDMAAHPGLDRAGEQG